jgi:hypothetical protein
MRKESITPSASDLGFLATGDACLTFSLSATWNLSSRLLDFSTSHHGHFLEITMKGVRALLFPLGQRLADVYRSPGQTLDAFSNFARCYFYALAFWSLITAKLLHLYAHLYSLPASQFILWGITFFFQDVAMLLLLRIVAQRGRTRPLAALGALVLIPFR